MALCIYFFFDEYNTKGDFDKREIFLTRRDETRENYSKKREKKNKKK